MTQLHPTQQTNTVLSENNIYHVFYMGKDFRNVELSSQSPLVEIGEERIQLTSAGVMYNGKPYTNQSEELNIQKNSELKSIATVWPTKEFTISSAPASAVRITTTALVVGKPKQEGTGYLLQVFTNGVRAYLNGTRIDRDEKIDFLVGDQLVLDGVIVELKASQIILTKIDNDFQLDPWQLPVEEPKRDYPLDFPNFRRSPRIRLREPKDQVEIKSPKTKASAGRNSVLAMIVPPLGMVILSVLISFMSDANPLWMLGMGGASVLTAGFSVSNYFADKKDVKMRNKQREAGYRHYMVEEKARLEELQQTQKNVLEYMYPSTEKLVQLVNKYNSRIYERMMQNDDFLNIQLGTGNITPSFKVLFRPNDEDDQLSKKAKKYLVEPYRELKEAPIVISLMGQTLGLAGNYNLLCNAVQSILWQLAVLHSYRDVEFITLIPETEYKRNWQDWRWLPHMKIKSLNLRGLVHNVQTKDMVLNSFYQILVKRRQKKAETGSEQIMFSPHYVLTILDETWLSGHQLNEFLATDLSELGVTVIWGKDSLNMLPETATTTVEYQGTESGTLVNRNNVFENQLFVPDHLPRQQRLAGAIERLANLHHVEAAKNTIPDSIDFLKLYGVKNVTELQIGERWSEADTSKSLAVPLGVRGKNDVVYLNLHERAHGPHGLIAGTTGSGKSEIIQSYILSLAVNYAPEDVGFLPIDFKGGGMANLFKNLPHMLGSITNLDGAGSARALASIRAELQKRQRLFGEYGVNHINGYTKLYKTGKSINDLTEKQKYPKQPLPHLFLISDEFAELKANEPDFMTELVSTARIGRSLGVHLILATQKPSGVVDDQIWSNSHFKLALKVSDPSDSNEIIKTPDAATITQPGRAYLQVGNNEIYELFQSAWSGAEYKPNQDVKKKVDERIWLLNDYGQQELLTPDLSTDEDFEIGGTTQTQTQLEAIVAEISTATTQMKAVLPEKPWLPPLDTEIVSPLLECQWDSKRNMQAPFAFMDLPSKQSKQVFNFDITELKHTAVYGSSGFGKSTALQTLVMNLARLNTPEQVQFNLFDFGTNGLLPLVKLPHTTDIVRIDQVEKLQKFIKRVRDEITQRKNMFTRLGVATLKQYEELTAKQLPVIITIMDGYDSVKDNALEDSINAMVDQLLREGSGLGLYLIMTALRTSSFKMSMSANIPSQIGLYLVEDGAIREIVGHEALIQQEIVGRAQMKYEEHPQEMQIYLPVKGKNDIERLNNLDSEIKKISKQWEGQRPASIPMLPETVSMQYFYDNEQVKIMLQKMQLPLALDKETTDAVGFDPIKQGYFVIANDTPQQTEEIEQILLEDLKYLEGRARRIVFNASERFGGNTESFDMIIAASQYSTFVSDLASEIVSRASQLEQEPLYIYVPDAHSFGAQSLISPETLDVFLRKAAKVKIYFIFAGNQKQIENNFDDFNRRLRANIPAGIIGSRMADQGFINVKTSFKEPIVGLDEAHFFAGREHTRIKLVSK